jgi:hypothetical protein
VAVKVCVVQQQGTRDDLFSSVCVCVCVRAWERERETIEKPELSITKMKMVPARFQAWLTSKQISWVDLSGKWTNKIMFRQVTALHHIPSNFVKKLWVVNMWTFSYRQGTNLTMIHVWRQRYVWCYKCLWPVCAANCRRVLGACMYSFGNGTLDGTATDTWRMRGRCVSVSHVPWKMHLCVCV